MKLPRLSVNWKDQPEMMRRYWDILCNAVEVIYPAGPTTVANLPSPSKLGARYFVSDATTTTYWAIPTGGGTLTASVVYDGTNWRIS